MTDDEKRRVFEERQIPGAVTAAERLAQGTGRTHVVMVTSGVIRIVDVERSTDVEYLNVVGVATPPTSWRWLAGLAFVVIVAILAAAWSRGA